MNLQPSHCMQSSLSFVPLKISCPYLMPCQVCTLLLQQMCACKLCQRQYCTCFRSEQTFAAEHWRLAPNTCWKKALCCSCVKFFVKSVILSFASETNKLAVIQGTVCTLKFFLSCKTNNPLFVHNLVSYQGSCIDFQDMISKRFLWYKVLKSISLLQRPNI